jgi:hypothetical protein
MAKKPTHYRLTVNRYVELANARFRPGARYTVTAAIHERLDKDVASAIATLEPVIRE